MQALAIIDKAQGGDAVSNLATTLGISEDQARAAMDAVLPELARGIERNTLSRAGLADFVTALGQGHHEQVLDTPAAWTDPHVITDGEAVLNHLTGSQRNTEMLAARAMQASGLGSSIIKLLLPILAQWLLGALTKSTKGGLGDILSRLPIPGGGASQPAPQRRSSRTSDDRSGGGFDTGGTMGEGSGGRNSGFDLPKSDLPGGGFPMPPIPGADDDGSARDRPSEDGRPGGYQMPWPGGSQAPSRERPRSGTGFDLPESSPPAGGYPMPPIPSGPESDDAGSGRGATESNGSGFPFPFPFPGSGKQDSSDNPYGDLSDILRRGGRLPSGEQAGGRGLGSVVRDTIGSALGFGKKGILGWIIQLVLLRWGWSFLKRILLGR